MAACCSNGPLHRRAVALVALILAVALSSHGVVAQDPVAMVADAATAMAAVATSLKVPASYGWTTSKQCNDGWTGVVCDKNGNPISIVLPAYTATGASVPTDVAALSKLQALVLNSVEVTGSIPTEIANIATLSSLALKGATLSGAIPDSLSVCTNLVFLSITGGLLSGEIPTSLGSLTRLKMLSIGSTSAYKASSISGSIPDSLSSLAPLEMLNLSWNKLQGSIPLSLSELTNLFSLDLSGNQLSEYIPPEITALPHLYEIDVSNNLLTGTLPPFDDDIDKISVHHNLLSGVLPRQFPQLLTYLSVASNLLSGPLPIFLPVNLTFVDFSDNYFIGIANVVRSADGIIGEWVKCLDLGSALSKNCFSDSSRCTSASAQRSATICKAVCGTVVWDMPIRGKSQCAGYGMCLPNIPVVTTTSSTMGTVRRPRMTPGTQPPSWGCACNTNAVLAPNKSNLACTCAKKVSWPCVAPGRKNGGCPLNSRCFPYYMSCRGVGCACIAGFSPIYNARNELVYCAPKTATAGVKKSSAAGAPVKAASVYDTGFGKPAYRGPMDVLAGNGDGTDAVGVVGFVSGPGRMGLEVDGDEVEGVWKPLAQLVDGSSEDTTSTHGVRDSQTAARFQGFLESYRKFGI